MRSQSMFGAQPLTRHWQPSSHGSVGVELSTQATSKDGFRLGRLKARHPKWLHGVVGTHDELDRGFAELHSESVAVFE